METGAKSKYKIDKYSFENLEGNIVLPSFQRKLVWSTAERKSFITTLHNGYPFGAILIYKYPNETKISLIDGLQRFTTIRDYRDNPQDYIEFDDFIDRLLALFVSENTPTSTKEHYKNSIEKTVKNFVSNLKGNTSSLALSKLLKENLSEQEALIGKMVEPIVEISDDLRQYINGYLDVAKIDIPAIEFTGSDTELATVFENLNRGGKKLSKYQVFAAQWYKYEVELSDSEYNKEILERTIRWYEELQESRKIEIENFDPDIMREEGKINVAELCFAFGQMILESTPVFWSGASDDTANEIGYSTMAIILGIKNKDLSTIIAEENLALLRNPETIEALVKATLDIYKDLNRLFQMYLHTPGNLNDFKYSLGTNFQILSYFAALWNIRYEVSKERAKLQSKQGSSRDYELTKKNLPKWYVYDTIESNWSGSGDSKLDLIAIEQNNKYLAEVASETLGNSLIKWYDEQMQKRSINFEPVAKMLYTMNASFDSNGYTAESYDLEHVIPRKLISGTSNKAIISGGTLGNLMFLVPPTNRSKKEQFMYDYIGDVADIKPEFLALHFYPQKKNLSDAKIELESKGNDYSNTQSVIKSRGMEIINALVKNLG